MVLMKTWKEDKRPKGRALAKLATKKAIQTPENRWSHYSRVRGPVEKNSTQEKRTPRAIPVIHTVMNHSSRWRGEFTVHIGKGRACNHIRNVTDSCHLIQLLGVWILLGQLPRALSSMDTGAVKLCGRELLRYTIWLCGDVTWRRFSRSIMSIRAADSASPHMYEDTKMLSTMPEVNSNFPEELLASEVSRELVENNPSEARDNSPSKGKGFGLETNFRKLSKKEAESLSDKCSYCQYVQD
ncbi:PREDICTED: prorelaxin-like [Elephantulus edwardii]|uniref:prorelaxin-like n=1 Tax=Elephantulus edwardii TaxID=28737 RepID=UPI0003F0D895|nr:PREDICTED: prorelaxin-like [Elephantulus edwardii]